MLYLASGRETPYCTQGSSARSGCVSVCSAGARRGQPRLDQQGGRWRSRLTRQSRPPALSIVIATYNAADSLQRCLDSIWSQDYQRIQVVVMDGGSGTGRRVDHRAKPGPYRLLALRARQGIYDAWNKALDHVTGDWVLFLGADDRLAAPDVLERASAALGAIDGQVRIAYGSVDVVDSSGRLVRRVGAPWADLQGLVSVGMPFGHQGTFHRRELFEDVGRFDTSYRISGDFELLLRELPSRPPQFVPDLVVVEMRAGESVTIPPRGAPPHREPSCPVQARHHRQALVASAAPHPLARAPGDAALPGFEARGAVGSRLSAPAWSRAGPALELARTSSAIQRSIGSCSCTDTAV